MKIDEAIKQLEDALADKWCPWSPELKKSIQLGIEAMRQIKWLHESQVLHDDELLPGETKE